jgi:hypothetical protein
MIGIFRRNKPKMMIAKIRKEGIGLVKTISMPIKQRNAILNNIQLWPISLNVLHVFEEKRSLE